MVDGIGAPVVAGLVIGIALVVLFSIMFQPTTIDACPDPPIPSPQLRLSVDGQEYVVEEGTLSGRCVEPKFDYVPIIDIGNISTGSRITLSVENYIQPDSLTLTIQNAGIYEEELKVADDGTVLVPDNIPPDRYGLIVQAKWNDIHAPFDTISYFFNTTVD